MIKKAHDAYNNKDFESTFKLYTQLSDEGNADAMASLGYMYQNAQGCDIDEEKALSLRESR